MIAITRSSAFLHTVDPQIPPLMKSTAKEQREAESRLRYGRAPCQREEVLRILASKVLARGVLGGETWRRC
jgi:hypothetical protein